MVTQLVIFIIAKIQRERNNKKNAKKRDGKDHNKDKDNKGFAPESYIDLLQKLVKANEKASFKSELAKPKEKKEKKEKSFS